MDDKKKHDIVKDRIFRIMQITKNICEINAEKKIVQGLSLKTDGLTKKFDDAAEANLSKIEDFMVDIYNTILYGEESFEAEYTE